MQPNNAISSRFDGENTAAEGTTVVRHPNNIDDATSASSQRNIIHQEEDESEEAGTGRPPPPRWEDGRSKGNNRCGCFGGGCCCCCRCFRGLDGNREAWAWLLDSVTFSILTVAVGAFLSTALIKLAKLEAGCETEPADGETALPDCDAKVYGMKPSSLLSNLATVVGLVAAGLLPLCGAVVDTTRHRRGLGRALAALVVAGSAATASVSESNWFAAAAVLSAVAFLALFETMVSYAYLPELADGDAAAQNRYTKIITVASFAAVVLFVAAVVGVTAAVDSVLDGFTSDEVGTARVAMAMATVVALIGFSTAWGRLFQPRAPSRTLLPTESIWTAGFTQIYRTAINVHKHYPMVQWFFVGIAVSDAAVRGLIVLGITYLTEVLQFSGAQNGAAIVVMLIATVPGGLISSWSTWRFNPVASSIGALCLLTLTTTLVAAFMKGPEQMPFAFLLAVGWGVGLGWKTTVDRMLFAVILPKNQNTELAGSYLFFKQSLSWLPPLIFTVLNENGVSVRLGMGSLNFFFLLGVLVYYFGVGIKRYDVYIDSQSDNHSNGIEDVEVAKNGPIRPNDTLSDGSSGEEDAEASGVSSTV